MRPLLPKPPLEKPAEAAPLSLGKQVTQLEYDRDAAKRETAVLKKEVEHLKQKNINDNTIAHVAKAAVEYLEGELDLADNTLKLEREKLVRLKNKRASTRKKTLEQVKSVARAAMHEANMLKTREKATADAIEALNKFLSKNEELTGDKFFGIGKEFDQLRQSIAAIPETESAECTKKDGLKRRAGYMEGKTFVVFGDIEGVKAGKEQHVGLEQDGRPEPPNKRVKLSPQEGQEVIDLTETKPAETLEGQVQSGGGAAATNEAVGVEQDQVVL